jgi:hypothetical protein
MAWSDPEPWLPAAMSLLDARRQDRVLACGVGIAGFRQLAAAVGRDGQLVAVTAQAGTGQALAALDVPHVRVLVHALVGDERFGAFDAMLVAPGTGPLLPPGTYADLARQNLRPGGRLVVDVPGPSLVPDLDDACPELGLPAARLAALHGADDVAIADAMRHAGLRNVHATFGGHLVPGVAAGELVAAFTEALQLTDPEQRDLAHALVRRHRGADAFDVMLHRARMTALR